MNIKNSLVSGKSISIWRISSFILEFASLNFKWRKVGFQFGDVFMEILSGKETADFLDNIVYLDTQLSEFGIDLTVDNIYKIEGSGEIDFGGDERKDADISEMEPSLRDSDDDYGWWELEPGTYLIEHNEDLSEEKVCIIQPLQRITRNSTTHPTKLTTELGKIPLHVGGKGIEIKENSRVSRIIIPKK